MSAFESGRQPLPPLPGPYRHLANGHTRARHGAGGHPTAMNAMTRGCLASGAVCFLSHKGELCPCGYLPVPAGDLRHDRFHDVWEDSEIFARLRDIDQLERKCGFCEFNKLCLGCRARAFGMTGNFVAGEPFCVYQPRRQADAKKLVPVC